ncbi:hypothetical protein LguiA_015877 [Lonicera macranthoides]
MNFMGSSKQGGYYEDEQYFPSGTSKQGKYFPSSTTSPSSSPSHHKSLLNNYQHRAWLEDTKFEPSHSDPSLHCSQLDLMDTSPGGAAAPPPPADVEDTIHANLRESAITVEKEHMFDKVVTPSDVGKLNRLVIPKQHAERYFPLDSSTNEKGLLLNFEDRNGKPWRFRYSYWNSSQSYVMTKGWSRFVKEKKLDAGDIVSFQRGVGESAKDRLFIDWRRRPDAPELNPPTLSLPHHFSFHRPIHPWNPLFLQPQAYHRDHSHLMQQNSTQKRYGYGGGGGSGTYNYNNGSLIYFRSAPGAAVIAAPQQRGGGGGGSSGGGGVGYEPMVFDSVPVVQGKAAAKRLRLFGVNMECPITESDECDILSSTTISHHHYNPSTATNTVMAHQSPPHQHLSSSSIPYLQLRPYNGTPIQTLPSPDFFDKGKASMSLDLDI